ncbi:MAG TPA: hypothetical protein VF145_05770 [Chitinophagaceae bacterium]
MKWYLKRSLYTAVFATILACSCSDSKTSPEEEKEITEMDSVSRAVEDSTKRLKEQTDRVEEKLEKLDNEFKSDSSNK